MQAKKRRDDVWLNFWIQRLEGSIQLSSCTVVALALEDDVRQLIRQLKRAKPRQLAGKVQQRLLNVAARRATRRLKLGTLSASVMACNLQLGADVPGQTKIAPASAFLKSSRAAVKLPSTGST